MNLEFSELDTNEQPNFEYNEFNNPEKYWDNQQKPITKKKKVSFNDILTNMNLVVNQQGVLQFMQPVQNEEYYPQQQYQQPQQQYQHPQQQYQQPYQEYVAQQLAQRQQQPTQYQQQQQQQAPIDPALKNSFLYNKYFKDYKDVAANNEPQIRVPKTMEEYRQMLLEDKIKELEQKKRIAEIKSTKLMFTANVPEQSNTIRPTRNNLRSMNFR